MTVRNFRFEEVGAGTGDCRCAPSRCRSACSRTHWRQGAGRRAGHTLRLDGAQGVVMLRLQRVQARLHLLLQALLLQTQISMWSQSSQRASPGGGGYSSILDPKPRGTSRGVRGEGGGVGSKISSGLGGAHGTFFQPRHDRSDGGRSGARHAVSDSVHDAYGIFRPKNTHTRARARARARLLQRKKTKKKCNRQQVNSLKYRGHS